MPDGMTLTYTYDAAHYLRSITDNLGNQIEYTYDLKGNRTKEETKDSDGTLVRVLQTTFDARDRVAAINAGGSLTQTVHDALGNLKQEIDPNNANATNPVATTHAYDPLNRLTETVDRSGGTTTYAYDSADRTTKVTFGRNKYLRLCFQQPIALDRCYRTGPGGLGARWSNWQ